MLRAAAILGAGPDGVGEAERSGLLQTDGDTVRVRHPLVRSAIYQAATSPERREAHRALADALGAGDPTGRRGTAPPLPTAPTRTSSPRSNAPPPAAERRGGYAAAAAAYERAAELTAAEPARAGLLFAAARNAWAAGQATRAPRWRCPGPRARRRPGAARRHRPAARPDRGQRRFGGRRAPHPDARRRAVAADDPDRALEMAVAAACCAVYGADSGTTLEPDRHRHPRPRRDDPPRTRCLKQLLAGTDGRRARRLGGGRGRPCATRQQAGADVDDLDLLAHLGNAALHLGDDEAAHRAFTAMLSQAPRARRRHARCCTRCPGSASRQMLAGQWTDAGGTAAEGARAERQRRAARAGRRPARLAGVARRPPGRTRLRRAAGPASTTSPRPTARRAGRPGPRPDPVGQGHPRRSATATPRRPAPPRPACGCRPSAAWPRSTASTPPSGRATTSRPRRGSTSWPRSPTRHRMAVGARRRRPRPGAARRPPTRRPCSRARWPIHAAPAAGRTTGPAPTSRTGSSCAAPSAASTPAPTCAPHWRLRGPARRAAGRPREPGAARLRGDRPQTRPVHR